MTQLNEEHFEVHTKNRMEADRTKKLKYLQDRIEVLEKSVAKCHELLGKIMGDKS
mgnify:FL=1